MWLLRALLAATIVCLTVGDAYLSAKAPTDSDYQSAAGRQLSAALRLSTLYGSRMRRLRRVAAFPIKPCALRKLGCGSASVLSLFRPPPAAPAFLARSPLVAPAGLAARALVNRHFGLPPIAAPPAPPSLLKRMEKRRIDAERAAEKRAGEAFMAASKPKRVRASQLVAAAALGPLGGIPPLLPLATPPTLLPIPTALIGPTPPLASNPLFRGLLEAERKARCKHEAVKPAPSENCDWHGFEDSKGCVKTFKCVPKEPSRMNYRVSAVGRTPLHPSLLSYPLFAPITRARTL